MFMKFIFALCILLTSQFTFSADKNNQFAVKGVGNVKCSSYVTMIQKNDQQKFLFAGWLNGFITSHNQHLENTFDMLSWENVETLGNYMYQHCLVNQGKSFFQASTDMLSQLARYKIDVYEGAITFEANGQTHIVYEQVVLRMKERLVELDLYKGEVDTVIDDTFKSAVKKYGAQKQIELQSIFDQRLLFSLLMEKPEVN
jgi:hypothetical protein